MDDLAWLYVRERTEQIRHESSQIGETVRPSV